MFIQGENIILDIIELSLECDTYNFNHIKRTIKGCVDNVSKLSYELRGHMIWRNTLSHFLCNPNTIFFWLNPMKTHLCTNIILQIKGLKSYKLTMSCFIPWLTTFRFKVSFSYSSPIPFSAPFQIYVFPQTRRWHDLVNKIKP